MLGESFWLLAIPFVCAFIGEFKANISPGTSKRASLHRCILDSPVSVLFSRFAARVTGKRKREICPEKSSLLLILL
jgi:hypothetical protein